MELKEDLIENVVVILVVQKNDVINKLVEANKLTKKDPKVSLMALRKGALDDAGFMKYVHDVVSQVRFAGLKGVFFCLKDDLNEQLTEDLKMFVDKLKEV